MRGRLRRILIALIILAAVVALAYQSRHKIHLADFTWNKFVASVSQANIVLLFFCLVGIYGCYAIRAVRWQRFCKYVGPTNFLNTYAGTLMGFAAIFVLGRAGEPVGPCCWPAKSGYLSRACLEFSFWNAFAISRLPQPWPAWLCSCFQINCRMPARI